MSRIIRNWKPENVTDTEVAPHRYRWDSESVDGDRLAMSIREFKERAPYQPGEVVYVQLDDFYKKARILRVDVDYDQFGDRRHRYQIQYETANGTWSKLFSYTFPGYIQRGYRLAGLAPEMPANA